MFLNQTKLEHFFACTARDVVYGPIMQDLQVYGVGLRYRFFRGNGLYKPQLSFLKNDHATPAVVKSSAPLDVCMRHGAGMAVYQFLHEAYHFYQDSFGMFCTPLLRAGQPAVLPDLKSFVYLVYLCEAMAATESVRAAWRLKDGGNDLAWRGVMRSLDWRKISNQYVSNIKLIGAENDAARMFFEAWYGSPLRRCFYEMQAVKLWRDMVKTAEEKTRQAVCPVSVSLSGVLDLMPFDVRPLYIRDMDLNQPLFMPRVSYRVQKYDIIGDGNPVEDLPFKYGSPAYLWRKSQGSS